MSNGFSYLAVIAIAGGLSAISLQGQSPSISAVFTKAQVDAGRTAYQAHCASCHTPDLGGRNEFPALAGDDFIASWKTRTTKDLFDFISTTMPPDGPALTPEQYLGITAHVLNENGAVPGSQALTPTTAVPIGTIATGKRPGAGAGSAAPSTENP